MSHFGGLTFVIHNISSNKLTQHKNISKLSQISTVDRRISIHKRKHMTKPAYLAQIYLQSILQSLLKETITSKHKLLWERNKSINPVWQQPRWSIKTVQQHIALQLPWTLVDMSTTSPKPRSTWIAYMDYL